MALSSALSAAFIACLLCSCSSTSALPEGEQLYIGQKPVKYVNQDESDHFITTQEELEYVLAAEPNGSLFGSSTLRNPFPISLWIWNATEGKSGGLAKWLNSSLGARPILMSEVNPLLRCTVAESTLDAYGYFRGTVDYKELTMRNPKKGKIAFTVNMGPLFTIDSLAYTHFPVQMDTILTANYDKSDVQKDEPFSVSLLDAERQRVSTLLRDNGYYYYQPGYASFLADTIAHPGNVQLRLQMVDSLDSKVYRKWYIGKTDIYMRNYGSREMPNSEQRRSLTLHYNGKRSPLKPSALLADLRLPPRRPFSETNYEESVSRLTANDVFSSIDMSFVPRDTTDTCDTLDVVLNCVLDKPYDISLEGNITGKTSSRVGPGVELSFTKRNIFRGGEKLSFNILGSYEWQTGSSGSGGNTAINSYEYGYDLTLEVPRLWLPVWLRKRWDTKPSTLIKISNQVINRGSFFNRHIMAGELTYTWQPTNTRKHIFSPLILEYDYMNRSSEEFQQIMNDNPYLYISMQDQFIPKMRYTFIYTSPANYLNPIVWETTLSESANLMSLAYVATGKVWGEKNKNLLGNPYAQFVKAETDFTKKWHTSEHSDLVAHVNAGVIWSYGNSEHAPYSEQFYVGGANSIRAFTVRSIGPGRYHTNQAGLSYLDQTGDIKFVANLEYRPRLFGNLYGAIFLDAGNVWAMRDDGIRGSESVFKPQNLIKDMAVATGLGVRYDLDYFVIRVDWGVGLHMPFDTGKSGFININSLKDVQSIHLAIGYPF